jgi:hypothetical protein
MRILVTGSRDFSAAFAQWVAPRLMVNAGADVCLAFIRNQAGIPTRRFTLPAVVEMQVTEEAAHG